MAMKSKYLVVLLFCASCADNTQPAAPSSPTPPGVTPSISSLSPATAIAGSDDITVTIAGSAFQANGIQRSSFTMWSESNGVETYLLTRFVSDTQLTAIIPAKLLKDSKSAQVFVVNGDWMGWADGFRGYPQSAGVSFTVVASR
jgi:hypothetical protein